MESFTDDQLGSLDLDLSDTPPPTLPANKEIQNMASNLRDPNHPDYMEIQSVTSGTATNRTVHQGEDRKTERDSSVPEIIPTHQELLDEFSAQVDPRNSKSECYEPLLPAKLKPRKEAINNHSKEQERGENSLSAKSVKSKEVDPSSSSVFSDRSDSSSSVHVTPLPEDQLSDQDVPKQPRYAAFTVNADLSQNMESPRRNLMSTALSQGDTAESVKLSYTVSQEATPESARAAGIPVVGDSGDQSWRRWGSREGSATSSRSSGDNSDHESRKIHYDQKLSENHDKTREVSPPKSFTKFGAKESDIFKKPKMIVRSKTTLSPKKEIPKHMTTNFAEIKRMKNIQGNVDNSGMVYMQHGHEVNNKAMQSSTTQINNHNNRSTTSPSRTTWQNASTLKSPDPATSDSSENSDTSRPVLSELTEIRLKLEEKRKQIEKKKNRMEIQQQKQRQRLGKTAFLHVLTKPTEEEASDELSSQGSETSLPASEEATPSLTPDKGQTLADGKASNTSQSNRAFSREGIQQTIENVRKKWFQEDKEERPVEINKKPEDLMTKSCPPKNEEALPKHLTSLPPNELNSKSMIATKTEKESTGVGDLDDSSGYSQRLEKLDHDLTDLKGEILRMSLEQEQFNGSPAATSMTTPPAATRPTYAVETPEQKLHGKAFHASDQNALKHMDMNTPERLQYGTPAVCRPAGYPCTVDPSIPTPERMVMGGGMSQYPQGRPPQMPVSQPFQPQVMPHPSPFNGQSQFSPMPHTQVPYSGFQAIGTTPFPQPQFPPTPPQVYQQTQPYNPNLVSPHAQYGMPGGYTLSPQQYPPHSHISPVTVPTPVSYINIPNHTGAQVFQPSPEMQTIPPASEAEKLPTSLAEKPPASSAFNDSYVSKGNISVLSDVSVQDMSQNRSTLQSDVSSDPNGFFVSFGDNSPKSKPKLSSVNSRRTVPSEPASLPDPTQPSPQQHLSSHGTALNQSGTEQDTSISSQNTSQHDSSGVGFVVGENQDNLSKVRSLTSKSELLIIFLA